MRVSRLEASYTAFSHCLLQDKQAVETYKANIKAQLTRAGLIRGQPRPPTAAPLLSSRTPPQPYHQSSDISPPSSLQFDHHDYYQYFDAPQEQHRPPNNNMIPGMPGNVLLRLLYDSD